MSSTTVKTISQTTPTNKGRKPSEEVEALKQAFADKEPNADQPVIVKSILGGCVPLNLIREINTNLSGDEREFVDAYKELVEIALRPKLSSLDHYLVSMYGCKSSELSDKSSAYKWYENEKRQWELNENKVQELLTNSPHSWKPVLERLKLSKEDLKKLFTESKVDKFEIDEHGHTPPSVLETMNKLGVFRMKFPTERNGLGFSQMMYAPLIKKVISTSETLGIITSVQNSLANKCINFGTKEQQDFLFGEVGNGKLVAFGLTEPQSGTDALRGMQTIAHKDSNNKWIINGEKVYITCTHMASYAFVMAKVNINGKLRPTGFILKLPFSIYDTQEERDKKIIELKKEGLNISLPIQLSLVRGSYQASLEFKNYVLPTLPIDLVLGGEKRLGKAAELIVAGLSLGRVGFGPICTELARESRDENLSHQLSRKVFPQYGGTLADVPIVKSHNAEIEADYAQAEVLSNSITAFIDKYGTDGNGIPEAALIKILASETNQKIARRVKTLMGGSGNIIGHLSGAELRERNAEVWVIGEGTVDVLRQLVVGAALKDFEKDGKAMLRFLNNSGLAWIKDLFLGKDNSSRLSILFNGVKSSIQSIFGNKQNNHEDKLSIRHDVIPAIRRFKDRMLSFQQGALSFWDAFWLQMQSKRLALKVAFLGLKYGDDIELKQRELTRMHGAVEGIVSVAIAQNELNTQEMPTRKRLALTKAIIDSKEKILANLNKLTLSLNKEDELDDKLVKAAIEEASTHDVQ